KGIKREFSNARTPQQNGVAERKNRTLIEGIRNRTYDYAGLETNSNAGKAGKDQVPNQEYILLPLLHNSSYVPLSSKKAEPHDDVGKKEIEQPACVEGDKGDDQDILDQQVKFGNDAKNININTASSSLGDLNALENTRIFDDAYDDKDEGTEAYYNNLVTKVTQALDDECWVEAMQEELLQFKLLNVWTLVDLPYGGRPLVLSVSLEIRKIKEELWLEIKLNWLDRAIDKKRA
ncbi:putative ribonuclease H-like domain-containing protein, partial [Tanacetum coccineum]